MFADFTLLNFVAIQKGMATVPGIGKILSCFLEPKFHDNMQPGFEFLALSIKTIATHSSVSSESERVYFHHT